VRTKRKAEETEWVFAEDKYEINFGIGRKEGLNVCAARW